MKIYQILLLFVLFLFGQTLSANNLPSKSGWLGVELEQVPLSLGRHLSEILKENQGILIRYVYPDSPAAKAELKPFDIIAQFNEQEIYAFEQLVQLVRTTPPGKVVNLKVIRQSKAREIKVTIDALPGRRHNHPKPPQFMQPPNRFKNPLNRPPLKDYEQFNYSWSSADSESVVVESLGENRYRAKIKYSNQQGKQTEFVYEGKLNEIIRQIKAQKELPDNRKRALLNALNINHQPRVPNPWRRLDIPPWFNDNYPPLMPWFD